jgi:hypothetical protein
MKKILPKNYQILTQPFFHIFPSVNGTIKQYFETQIFSKVQKLCHFQEPSDAFFTTIFLLKKKSLRTSDN